jgi:single-stranded-DNA-specific exonuclease
MNENYQTELGKDIFFIVTDHHHISETTPPKDITAFVSPQRKDSIYPDREICGAFVAWNLIAATNSFIREKGSKVAKTFDENSLFDYVSCATVGDMMNLKSQNNRSAIQKGIELFNSQSRPAWSFMLSKVAKNGLDEETIGFQLSPRINALSRMGDNARVAFRFLTSKEEWDIASYWDTMDISNNVRKEEQKLATDIVVELAKETENLEKNGLVFFVPKAEHGVVGLCSNELVKQYGKPSIVLSSKENGEIVGSGRSIAGIDIREILAEIQEELGCFTKFGGHTMACGLSLKSEFLEQFKEVFNEKVSIIAAKNLKPIFKHDGFLNKDLLDLYYYQNIEKLKPFGQGFEKPSFLIQGKIKQESIRQLGQSGLHFKVQIESNDTVFDCVWFKTNPEEWIKEESLFLVELSKNSFRGVDSIQVMISVQEKLS